MWRPRFQFSVATPLRLMDKPEESPPKRKKIQPLDPRDAFIRVMSASMEEFEMPQTNTILDIMNLLGISVTEAHSITALPINVVHANPMIPSGSNLSKEDLDVEHILQQVSTRRSGSPQKSEGQPIDVERDAKMDPTAEDKTFQSEIVSRAEDELILTTTPVEEIEVAPEASHPTELEALNRVEAKNAKAEHVEDAKAENAEASHAEAEHVKASTPVEASTKQTGDESTKVPALATDKC